MAERASLPDKFGYFSYMGNRRIDIPDILKESIFASLLVGMRGQTINKGAETLVGFYDVGFCA